MNRLKKSKFPSNFYAILHFAYNILQFFFSKNNTKTNSLSSAAKENYKINSLMAVKNRNVLILNIGTTEQLK